MTDRGLREATDQERRSKAMAQKALGQAEDEADAIMMLLTAACLIYQATTTRSGDDVVRGETDALVSAHFAASDWLKPPSQRARPI